MEASRRSLQFGDGRRVVLTLQPDGSYRNLTDGLMQGAVLTSPGGVPTVRWKDGSQWVFGVTNRHLFPGFPAPIEMMGEGPTASLRHERFQSNDFLLDPFWFGWGQHLARWNRSPGQPEWPTTSLSQ